MIISSIPKKGDQIIFGIIVTVMRVSTGKSVVKCTLKDENSNQIIICSFLRVGGDIKSGIDLGRCQGYIPAEKKPRAGEKITLPGGTPLTIKKVLKKNKDGRWSCIVSYGSAISCFLKKIRI
ncbi:MAG: hypothetical protein Q7U36_00925 [bacterium]|nr:hypothetical protein [bacterium]